MKRRFSLSEDHAPKAGLTISTREMESDSVGVTYFSLGRNMDIGVEHYPEDVLYLSSFGGGGFRLRNAVEKKERLRTLTVGTTMLVRKNTLCSVRAEERFIYTEVIPGKDITMNEQIKAGEVFRLSDLFSYEKGSVVNTDATSNLNMKFVVMASDADTGLSEHSTSEDTLIFTLKGKGEIVYEGTPHNLKASDQFHMIKDGRHSVKTNGQFKMALLLVPARAR